jgi:leucyl aminopeptidase
MIHSYSGTSIEIIDTDAEGRLVLDGISIWLKNYKPEYIVDIAHLPVVVLVHCYECGALFTNNELSKNYKMQEIQ